LVFGALTTRRAGTVFALISLGVGELVYAATFMLPSLFGGEEGITASRTRAPFDLGSRWVAAPGLLRGAAVGRRRGAAHVCLRPHAGGTPCATPCATTPSAPNSSGTAPSACASPPSPAAALFAGLAGGLHALNYEIVAADAVSAQRSGPVLIMAYIGGAAHFIGPVLGAIVITWLESSLSGYTSAWLLYIGVFFVVMILYAPRGLAGLITMHRPLLGSPALGRLLATYVYACIPLALMLAGTILLVEMSYRLATQPELGTRMRLLWTPLDAASPWPWVAAVAALAGGFLWLRATFAVVAAAWQRARPDA
jgi:branched-chain amino acid transport system permease protein